MAITEHQQLGAKTKLGAALKLKHARATKPPVTKFVQISALLRRTKGASINELMNATGWQHHSVRGFLSGTLVKQKGLKIASEKTDGERRYRVIAAEAAS